MYAIYSRTGGNDNVTTRRIDIIARSSSTLDDVKRVAAVGRLTYGRATQRGNHNALEVEGMAGEAGDVDFDD